MCTRDVWLCINVYILLTVWLTESVCTFVTGLCYTLLQLIQYLIVGSDYSVSTWMCKGFWSSPSPRTLRRSTSRRGRSKVNVVIESWCVDCTLEPPSLLWNHQNLSTRCVHLTHWHCTVNRACSPLCLFSIRLVKKICRQVLREI